MERSRLPLYSSWVPSRKARQVTASLCPGKACGGGGETQAAGGWVGGTGGSEGAGGAQRWCAQEGL